MLVARWRTFIPNFGTLGLRVLELFGMYARRTDGQTDGRTDKCKAYCPFPTGGGIIKIAWRTAGAAAGATLAYKHVNARIQLLCNGNGGILTYVCCLSMGMGMYLPVCRFENDAPPRKLANGFDWNFWQGRRSVRTMSLALRWRLDTSL